MRWSRGVLRLSGLAVGLGAGCVWSVEGSHLPRAGLGLGARDVAMCDSSRVARYYVSTSGKVEPADSRYERVDQKLKSEPKFRKFIKNHALHDTLAGPDAGLFALPPDAVRVPYVGEWSYYYRPSGMQTSTDDILVAAMACQPKLCGFESTQVEGSSAVNRYLDLGTGIGSSLLIVAYNLQPTESIGIEAQQISFAMASQSVRELGTSRVKILHADLRNAIPLVGERSFDLITANPPFSRVDDGVHSLPQDEQRRFARFELRGGIEDYCAVAQRLLRPAGRFILAFWHKDNGLERVQAAAAASGLYCTRRVDVVGGSPTNSQPHISVFEFALLSAARNDSAEQAAEQVVSLDIRRDSTTGGLSPKYKEICRSLGLHGRPLKIKTKTKKTHE